MIEQGYRAVDNGSAIIEAGLHSHLRPSQEGQDVAENLDAHLFNKSLVTPVKLPLAIHANLLTSLIGVATLGLFWIPIPVIHFLGWETFELPWGHWGLMITQCVCGATYVSL